MCIRDSANTTLQTVEDFERLVLRESDGALLYLRDIARVELGEEEGEVSARYSQQDALYLSIWPVPGANEIAIGDDLYEVLEKINATLPDGLRIRIAYDGTLYMRDAIREIFTTLLETIVLVGIVVLALMGSVRTALVPLVAIPISLLGAVAAFGLARSGKLLARGEGIDGDRIVEYDLDRALPELCKHLNEMAGEVHVTPPAVEPRAPAFRLSLIHI